MNTGLFIILLVGGVWGVWYLQTSLPVLKTIEPFQLTSALTGERYTSDNDRIKVVAFFYTACPDVCPFTMRDLKEVYGELEAEGVFEDKVEFISITLDPEADTSKRIERYAGSFDADVLSWRWLRGTEEETLEIAKQFQMQRVKLADQTIAHSTTLYLVDDRHQIRGTYAMATYQDRVNREELMRDVLLLVEK
ncbi:SCO family protein [Jeotgalibacillus salarius]|uniref:SCO family protein n=1 Tax=Jeotgalibacillus salarius TaxID=546023 RepID=UPI00141B0939|nr:SCO family protein [Jeotgalibacillus salarius]